MVVAVCLDGGVYGRAAHPASAANAINERGSLHMTRNHIESRTRRPVGLLINQMDSEHDADSGEMALKCGGRPEGF